MTEPHFSSHQDAPVSNEELRTRIREYSSFLDETLHPQLQAAVAARQETQDELHEYHELHDKLQALVLPSEESSTTNTPMESLVDLGHELVYACARIDNGSTIFVHVGFGFHVELTLQEAMVFCRTRIAFLESNVLPRRVKEAQTVAAHLESSMVLLESLSRELRHS